MSEAEDREKRIQESWRSNAEAWTQAVRQEQIESRKLATNAAIVAAVVRHKPFRVLDLGCGEGWLARVLADQGMEVVGTDFSETLIEEARRLGGGEFVVLSYDDILEDAEQLGTAFDAVVCNYSLLGEDVAPLLRVVKERLTARGHLFIQTVHPFTASGDGPYEDGWKTETFDGFGGAFPEPMPWYFRTIGSWISMLSLAGFTLVECEEPLHPTSKRPLSLLLVSRAA